MIGARSPRGRMARAALAVGAALVCAPLAIRAYNRSNAD